MSLVKLRNIGVRELSPFPFVWPSRIRHWSLGPSVFMTTPDYPAMKRCTANRLDVKCRCSSENGERCSAAPSWPVERAWIIGRLDALTARADDVIALGAYTVSLESSSDERASKFPFILLTTTTIGIQSFSFFLFFPWPSSSSPIFLLLRASAFEFILFTIPKHSIKHPTAPYPPSYTPQTTAYNSDATYSTQAYSPQRPQRPT